MGGMGSMRTWVMASIVSAVTLHERKKLLKPKEGRHQCGMLPWGPGDWVRYNALRVYDTFTLSNPPELLPRFFVHSCPLDCSKDLKYVDSRSPNAIDFRPGEIRRSMDETERLQRRLQIDRSRLYCRFVPIDGSGPIIHFALFVSSRCLFKHISARRSADPARRWRSMAFTPLIEPLE